MVLGAGFSGGADRHRSDAAVAHGGRRCRRTSRGCSTGSGRGGVAALVAGTGAVAGWCGGRARSTPWSCATARRCRTLRVDSERRRRGLLACRLGAGAARVRSAVAVLAAAGARGIRRRPDRAHRLARAPGGGGRGAGALLGGRRRVERRTTARSCRRGGQRSGCASASGTPAGACGRRSRLRWNGRPGSTTSG